MENNQTAVKKKITDWKNEPSMTILQSDLMAGRSRQKDRVNEINHWEDLRDIKNSAKPPKIEGKSGIQPKVIRRQAEWRYSALTEAFLSTEKLFDVRPATFEDTQAANQNMLVLNHQIRNQLNLVEFIDSLVRNTVDQGTTFIKVAWNREVKTVKEERPSFIFYAVETEDEMAALQQAIELKTSNPREYDALPEEVKAAAEYSLESGTPVVASISGYEEIEIEEFIKNQPDLVIRDSRNIIVDPSCNGDLSKAKFLIDSIETCRADLEASSIEYTNLDAVSWDGTSVDTDSDHYTNTPKDFRFTDSPRKGVVMYEYWGYFDIDGSGTLSSIVVSWIGNVIVRMEKNPFPDGKIPYVVARYMPRRGEVYGETDAELLEDTQKLIGAMNRGIVDSFARTANGQRGIPKGFVDPVNRKRMDSGADFEYNPDALMNNQGFIQAQFPEIPQSVYQYVMYQNQEAESLTGTKSFSGGLSGEGYGKVAAGIRGMLDSASKREMAILRRIASAVVDMGKKMAAMNAVWLSEKEIVRVTNEEFVEIDREDLKGHFDIIVDIATAEIDNSQAEDLSFMLQTLGNNIDFGITKMLLAKIASLKRMPELAKSIERFERQPSPEEQRMMELEMQIKEAELQKLQSEIEYNRARAMHTMSNASAVDVDTQMQASGVKHQQALQKQRAQAQGNQDYEVTKALLKSRKADELPGDIEAAVGFNTLTKQQQ